MSYNKLPSISIPSLNLETIKAHSPTRFPAEQHSATFHLNSANDNSGSLLLAANKPPHPPSPAMPKRPIVANSYDFYVDIDSAGEEAAAEVLPKIVTPSLTSLEPDAYKTPRQQHDTLDLNTQPPINLATQTVKELYARYQTEPYMFQKMHNYICFQLPTILENMRKTHIERQLRVEEMTQEQDVFIHDFLSKNQYFYCGTTEFFFKYDGLKYEMTSENDILYHILSTISKKKQLMTWKQKTKVSLLKRIKNQPITKSMPESETIQLVYDFLIPAIFSSKAEAKYFLCVIGDTILKKTGNDLIFFIGTEAKHFIKEVSNMSVFFFGINLMSFLKVKYYQHTYEYSRLVPVSTQIKNATWTAGFAGIGLDLITVACHYSSRYENADNYLNSFCNDSRLINYVYFLKMRTPETIVKHEFIAKYLQKCDKETGKQLSWKNMQYLWKHYLDTENLPNIMFQQTLKNILCGIDFMEYRAEDDAFQNMTSHYLPAIQYFLSFWKETISYQTDATNEFEVEELCILYRKWCAMKRTSYHHSTITDKQMLDYIGFYCPEIEVEQNKYVYNIKCSLWDKQLDIQTAINEYINAMTDNSAAAAAAATQKEISVYDAYLWYCKFYGVHNLVEEHTNSISQSHLIASKLYFEKYVAEMYPSTGGRREP